MLKPNQSPTELSSLLASFISTRDLTERLAENLSAEDQMLQSMPDASPTKWHLAHTSWFFETFILLPHAHGYQAFANNYDYLFNSYYQGVGPQYPRPQRGLISRPGSSEVMDYRHHITEQVLKHFEHSEEQAELFKLGIQHEQQHQELLLTDIKHALSFNPSAPVFLSSPLGADNTDQAVELKFESVDQNIREIGACGREFCFDNELPRHQALIPAHKMANRLVTNGEYIEFIEDGGYQDPLLWLSEGWAWRTANAIEAPLYWQSKDGSWIHFTLSGRQPVALAEPVTHVSYYEADAFARWAGKRLPTEFEWEHSAAKYSSCGNLLDLSRLHPRATTEETPSQFFGDTWEWTQSNYSAYPGYRPLPGAVGEYNGKFMCNQMVLRGGSCVTPGNHIRLTYRNFFPTDARWQFSGIRLAAHDE